MTRPPAARARALEAATEVLTTRSAAAFTLDEVAATAGISKGGLMYHFPTKEALLQALVAAAVDEIDVQLADAAGSAEPGAFARAYLATTVPEVLDDETVALTGPTGALAAAVALDPRLLEPLRERYRAWQARLESDGIDPAAATVVRLAVDGWWLAALLGLDPLPVALHRSVRERLDALTRPAVPGRD